MRTSYIVTIHRAPSQTSPVMHTLRFSTYALAMAHIVELCKAGYLAYISGTMDVDYDS